MSTGRLSALVAYAAVPWFVHLLRVAVGIGTADPAAADTDLVDGVLAPSRRDRVRRTAMLTIAAALAVALAPAVLPVLVVVTVVLALTTIAANAGMRTAGWMAGLGLVACVGAWVLNLPWSTTWSWSDLTAAPLAGAPGRGLADVASMAIGRGQFELVSLLLYAPVLIALLVARAWRLTWAARAAGLVIVFLGLAVLQDRDALPFQIPEIGILLVPVGLGLAISAAASIAAFGGDVAGRTFGWRQPLGLLAIAAVVVGVVPALFTLTDGAWYAPRASLTDAIEIPLPPAATAGDYRVLYVGDPRVIPFPSDDLGDGVAMAVVDDGGADSRDRWPVADGTADDALRDVVRQLAAGGTRRGGRLLAPFGIRFVVVPVIDGAASTASDALARAGRVGRGARGPARPDPFAHTAELHPVREPERAARHRPALGPAGRRVQGDVGRRAGRRRHVDGDAGVPDGRRDPEGHRRRRRRRRLHGHAAIVGLGADRRRRRRAVARRLRRGDRLRRRDGWCRRRCASPSR